MKKVLLFALLSFILSSCNCFKSSRAVVRDIYHPIFIQLKNEGDSLCIYRDRMLDTVIICSREAKHYKELLLNTSSLSLSRSGFKTRNGKVIVNEAEVSANIDAMVNDNRSFQNNIDITNKMTQFSDSASFYILKTSSIIRQISNASKSYADKFVGLLYPKLSLSQKDTLASIGQYSIIKILNERKTDSLMSHESFEILYEHAGSVDKQTLKYLLTVNIMESGIRNITDIFNPDNLLLFELLEKIDNELLKQH